MAIGKQPGRLKCSPLTYFAINMEYMSPVCAHQRPRGWKEFWQGQADGGWLVFLPLPLETNLEGYTAWLGVLVGASKAVWSSRASAQEGNAEGQAGGQGPGFQSCVCGHSLLEQALRKAQEAPILPRLDFPPKNPKLDRCTLVLPERDTCSQHPCTGHRNPTSGWVRD